MSEGLVPVMVMPIVAPRSEHKKSPYILDESVPKMKDPNLVLSENMNKRILERAKSKPDEERNFMDYLVLAQDKLSKMPEPVCYIA